MPFENLNFGLLQPTVKLADPAEQMAKFLQMKQLQQQSELGGMQVQEHRQGMADEQAAREVLQQVGGDPEKAIPIFRQKGMVKMADNLEKAVNERKMASVKDAKAKLELGTALNDKQLPVYSYALDEIKKNPAAFKDIHKWALSATAKNAQDAGLDTSRTDDPPEFATPQEQVSWYERKIATGQDMKTKLEQAQKNWTMQHGNQTLEETQRHNRVMEKKATATGMGSGALTPDDKAASIQAAALALVQGRGKWPSGRELGDPILGQAINVARKMDPTLNQGTFALRQNAQKEADTGKTGQSNNAIKTVLGHTGHLVDAYIESPDIGAGKGVNWLVGKTKEILPGGNPGLQKVYDLVEAIGPEMAKAYVPGQGTEGERHAWKDRINPFRPDPERKASMGTFAEMLITKLNANEAQYRKSFKGLSENAVPPPIQLDEESYNALKKIEAYTGKPIKGAAKWMQRYEQSENPQNATPTYPPTGAANTLKPKGAASVDDLLKALGH